MEYRILGPFSVAKNGAEIAVGGGRQRALLALLLLHANEAVSTDRLIDQLWGESPSTSATKIVQNYVSKLRRLLGDGVVVTRGHGYELRVEPGELDVDRFNDAVAAARRMLAASDPEGASAALSAALGLWRGPPLADFAYEDFARPAIERLEELRVAALTDRIEADLQLGRHDTLIAELETLVAQHPLQERLRAQLMLALYRSGRQAEALQVYQATRKTLVDELGIEPGEALQHLERAVLTHDPAIDHPAQERSPAAATVPPRRGIRNSRVIAAGLGAAAVATAVALGAWGGDSAKPPVVTGNAVAIIDPASNRVTGQVAVGVRPQAIAVGAGGLWVANLDDQTVSHVDVASRKLIRNVPVGGVPLGLAVGRKAVWVVRRQVGSGSAEIVKIDPHYDLAGRGRLLRGEPNPYGGAGIAVGRDGVWVAADTGLLERFDLVTKTFAPSIETDNAPASVAVGPGAIWTGDARGDSVARIDPATKLVVKTISVGNGADAVATGFHAVWAVDTVAGTVVRIDPATNSVTITIPVGRSPTGIAVGLGGVWVANSRDGTVSRIDPSRNKVVETITVGGSPRAVAVGNGRVWVSVQNRFAATSREHGGVAHVNRERPFDSLDPALAYQSGSWSIEYATCAKLLNYPDRPRPAGSRLEPEVASTLPVVSAGGKRYTFTIREGFRFSPPSNAPVTAQTFKFTIERALNRKIGGPATAFDIDIVGLRAYEAGKASHISGVRAHGNTLTIELTRVAPVILSQLALPFFCAVPIGTPLEAKGVEPVPAAAGPYYVTSYTPGQGAVLKRNPNYHGARPHTLDEIDYRLGVGKAESVKAIETGAADFAADGLPPDQVATLARRYGPGSTAGRAGNQRYFVNPWLDVWYLAMNTSRPLFANADLRRAVNYALNRRAIVRASEAGGYPARPTDQFLPSGFAGFRDIHAYPFTPDLARAKQLAGGHTGHALLYTCIQQGCVEIAQLIKAELAPLGISVEIKALTGRTLFARAGTRGDPFDLALNLGWLADYPDPSNFLNQFDGRSIKARGNANISYFDEPAYNRRLAAAAELSGRPRSLAYEALDADLTREAAPAAPLFNGVEQDLFSARIGCQVYQPVYGIDLAALCLKKH